MSSRKAEKHLAKADTGVKLSKYSQGKMDVDSDPEDSNPFASDNESDDLGTKADEAARRAALFERAPTQTTRPRAGPAGKESAKPDISSTEDEADDEEDEQSPPRKIRRKA